MKNVETFSGRNLLQALKSCYDQGHVPLLLPEAIRYTGSGTFVSQSALITVPDMSGHKQSQIVIAHIPGLFGIEDVKDDMGKGYGFILVGDWTSKTMKFPIDAAVHLPYENVVENPSILLRPALGQARDNLRHVPIFTYYDGDLYTDPTRSIAGVPVARLLAFTRENRHLTIIHGGYDISRPSVVLGKPAGLEARL